LVKKLLTKRKKTLILKIVMNTTTNSNVTALASLIAEIVINKGTAFAGFDYNGKRRNVTLGSSLSKHVSGGDGGNRWGKSFAKSALVEYNGKLYLQGTENNAKDGFHPIKRFDLSKATNFVIG
jgi:hypothetical protein